MFGFEFRSFFNWQLEEEMSAYKFRLQDTKPHKCFDKRGHSRFYYATPDMVHVHVEYLGLGGSINSFFAEQIVQTRTQDEVISDNCTCMQLNLG